jgi:hypothetical protein
MTDILPPMPMKWTGAAMVPLQPQRAERFYEVGQRYVLTEVQGAQPVEPRPRICLASRSLDEPAGQSRRTVPDRNAPAEVGADPRRLQRQPHHHMQFQGGSGARGGLHSADR